MRVLLRILWSLAWMVVFLRNEVFLLSSSTVRKNQTYHSWVKRIQARGANTLELPILSLHWLWGAAKSFGTLLPTCDTHDLTYLWNWFVSGMRRQPDFGTVEFPLVKVRFTGKKLFHQKNIEPTEHPLGGGIRRSKEAKNKRKNWTSSRQKPPYMHFQIERYALESIQLDFSYLPTNDFEVSFAWKHTYLWFQISLER